MPSLRDVKETCLYVDDLDRARKFYEGVMGLKPLFEDPRFYAFDVAGRHVLLIFVRGASMQDTKLPGGTIPAHDGAGPVHAGFAVDSQDLPEWESHFAAHSIEILSRVSWPKGGQSVYFRDPDGHLLELLTPGVWATY